MNEFENNYIRIPDDIEFLLNLCRDLIRIIKESNQNEEVPITAEKLARLRMIRKLYSD